MSTIALHLTLNISQTVEAWTTVTYGVSSDHVTPKGLRQYGRLS